MTYREPETMDDLRAQLVLEEGRVRNLRMVNERLNGQLALTSEVVNVLAVIWHPITWVGMPAGLAWVVAAAYGLVAWALRCDYVEFCRKMPDLSQAS